MKTTAFPSSREQFPSWSGLTVRVPNFIALMSRRGEFIGLTKTNVRR